jgi:hypothetical protein
MFVNKLGGTSELESNAGGSIAAGTATFARDVSRKMPY